MAINFLFDVSVNSGIDLQNTSITSLATPVNSTDAATKAYVDALVTASDLDFSGTNGTGAVDLDSQVFAVTGGTFISTAASGQSLSIDLNATGSPSVTTFLRGDNTWSTPPDNNTTYTFAAVSGTPNLIRLTGTNPSSTNDIGLVATGNIAITFNSATSLGFDLASSISVANTITAGTGLTVTTGGVDVTGTGTFNTGISVTGDSSINGELDMSSNKIINVTDPTNAQDAATKNYVDITSTSGAVNFQGGYDAATNTPDLDSNPSSAIKKGWMYTVTADGTFFTEQVRTGDSLIAQIDAPTTLANWTTVQNNIDLADASTVGIGNVAGGTGIGVSYSGGTATVSQGAVTLNQNTSSATPGSGGTFTAIDSVTTNSTGHLTDYNLKTVTLPTATVSGGGTANYISKWNTTSALTDSLIYDTGTQLGIATTSPDSGVILQVGDGTVSEKVRIYDSSNKYIDLFGSGVYFTRNNSYLRPNGTASAQTLYIGDNLGGSNPNRSWGAIRSNFNDFWFTDNGVKVMRIHDEKVGIGTGAVYPNTASEKLHVDGNFRLTGSFKDGSNGAGTSGQVLSSTGTSTSWITLPADNNNYVTSASFGTGTGVLTLNRQGLTAVTVSLDGRYLTGNQNITLTGDVTGGPSATSIATTISANVVGANELNVSSNGTSGQVLTSDGLGAFTWTTPFTGDITGVTAGNGLTGGGTSGTVELTVGQGTGIIVNTTNVALAPAGAGAGTYGSTSDSAKIDTITLDAYGRVTSVSTGSTGSGSMSSFTLTGDSGTSQSISNGNTVDIAGGTNISTVVGSTDTVTINMDTGGIGAGTYGSTANDTKIDQITVDAYGRVTAVSTGATGDITAVNAGTNLTGGGTSGSVTLNMATGGIGAGTYGNTSDDTKIDTITVDAYGRITGLAIGATGDITAVNAGDYLSGGATQGSATLNLDVGATGDWWGKGVAVRSDGVMEVGKYIDFHDADAGTGDFDFRITSGSGRLYFSGDLEVDGGDIYINDTNTRITEGSSNSIRLQTNSGYVDVGPQNSTYSHFNTDRAAFYFNKEIQAGTGVVRSYNQDLNLNRAGSSTARLRITSGNTISDQNFQVSDGTHTLTVDPHTLGINLHSTGNLAPHYQTDFTLYTGAIGSGTARLRVNSDGSIQQGNSSASGQYAAAFGQNNTANSLEAFATGENTTAQGRQSFSGGFNTTASGAGSFAIGGNSVASGINSLCAGGDGTTPGTTATSIGTLNDATNHYTFAAGYNSTASGLVSFAMGSGTVASGHKATAFGEANGAGGELDFAIGAYNTSTPNLAYGNFMCGYDNNIHSSAGPPSSLNILGGTLNEIGYSGIANTSGDLNIVSGSNNNIGFGFIGTATAASAADRNIVQGNFNTVLASDSICVGRYNRTSDGSASATIGFSLITPTNGATSGTAYGTAESDTQFIVGRWNNFNVNTYTQGHRFAVGNGTSDSARFTALNVLATTTGTARVGIAKDVPAYPLDVTGTGRFTGGTTTSDERLKENIQDNTLGLSELVQLRTVTFDWKTDEDLLGRTMEDHPQNKNCKGLIAQEAEAVSSDLVETDDSEHGIKSINQGALTTMLIKAIQEQQDIIESLTERIQALENN
jgi:trimeric autotransporter adhesin